MNTQLTIRFADITDLPAIVDIYNQAIRSRCATGDLDKFDVEDRREWFGKYDSEHYPLYVAQIGKKVVGYCTLSPYRPGRRAMAKVAEISYYLDYSFHKMGIGTALLNHAISDCGRIDKETLLAILLDVNTQSIGILEKFGFEKWGHYPGIIDLEGKVCGHLVYGLKMDDGFQV